MMKIVKLWKGASCKPAKRRVTPKILAFAPDHPANPRSAKVVFSLKQRIPFGKHVAVVGSNFSLGGWDSKAALELQWNEGDSWKAQAEVPVDEPVEFKFVIRDDQGVEWQPGDNILVTVPEKEGVTILIEGAWADGTTKVVPLLPTLTETVVEQFVDDSVDLPKDEFTVVPTQPIAVLGDEGKPKINLEGITVAKLRALASEMGVSARGKKTELIARLKEAGVNSA